MIQSSIQINYIFLPKVMSVLVKKKKLAARSKNRVVDGSGVEKEVMLGKSWTFSVCTFMRGGGGTHLWAMYMIH